MTGFDRWLEQQTRLPQINNSMDALSVWRNYRKSLHSRYPWHGKDLAGYRKNRQRPSGRIVITDEIEVADALMNMAGQDYPLLIKGHANYDFSPVYGIPVLYLMPDHFWALDVAHQIADAEPSEFALIWPNSDHEEVLWNS